MEDSNINKGTDLKQLLGMLWNGKWIIIIFVLLGFIIGWVYAKFFVTPVYTATVKLILTKDESESDTQGLTTSDVSLNDKLIETYKVIAKDDSIVNEVRNNLNLDMSSAKLKNEISISAQSGTQIININVTDQNASLAASIAEELADLFPKKIKEIYKVDNLQRINKDKVEKPRTPSNIHNKRTIIIFMAGGFILALVIIILKNTLKSTISTSKDIEDATGLLVLAELPECEFGSSNKKKK